MNELNRIVACSECGDQTTAGVPVCNMCTSTAELCSPAAQASATIKVAPRVPTEEMQHAARDWSVKKYGIGIGKDAAIGCWQAMWDAATVKAIPSKALDENSSIKVLLNSYREGQNTAEHTLTMIETLLNAPTIPTKEGDIQ